MTKIKTPKKLIEVALPLDDINVAAAREKSIRHGHPSTLHLWWARRPLAAARAVLFAQMVNDPGYQQGEGFKYGVNKIEAEIKREKLFQIIRDLVKWENTNNEEVLNRAREAILESWRETCHLNRNHPKAAELFNPEKLPASHDPFAGGGAIPLEALRLGLDSYASDLNPIPIMINKAMIELPQRFSDLNPIGPARTEDKQQSLSNFEGLTGLAEDVRRYGDWVRDKAYEKIGHFYPEILVTNELAEDNATLKPHLGKNLTVICWVWARTIPSPNPSANGALVPITSTFVVGGKGDRTAYVEPVVNGTSYAFVMRIGEAPKEAKNGTKLGRGANFKCILTDTPISDKYLKEQACMGNLGQRLLAIVAESPKGKVFIAPNKEAELLAFSAQPEFIPQGSLSTHPQYMGPPRYGMRAFSDLFTKRQLTALSTFLSFLDDLENKVYQDAIAGGFPDDNSTLNDGGKGALAYAQAIRTYIAFSLDRSTNYWSGLNAWSGDFIVQVFSRQVVPMIWDFAEVNPFSDSTGNWRGAVNWVARVLDFSIPPKGLGHSLQCDASSLQVPVKNPVVSTDPPYYDNVPYADISDYFYVWMRPALKSTFPEVFETILVPKEPELVADSQRWGGKQGAEDYFLSGMTKAMRKLSENAHPAFPVTIYYAFRQGESTDVGTGNTGWETFLQAVLEAGFSIVGTWPVRTERPTGMKVNWNALASSIVLVCRRRDTNNGEISRRDFQRYLRKEMPEALETMIGGETGQTPIAPVDLAQSAIGPGMAIFSKHEAVLNQDGSRMSVHDALILINRSITEYLSPESGSFDADTQFCSSWFDQYGWSTGPFGEADTLARAKGTSVDGVREAGVVESGGGKVRLLKWSEYEADWDPTKDNRTPIWEACHQMIRRLNNQGESAAGELLAKMPEKGESIRQLAYHLYTLCERKKWAEDARAYNELIGSWHAIVAASHEVGHRGTQTELGLDF